MAASLNGNHSDLLRLYAFIVFQQRFWFNGYNPLAQHQKGVQEKAENEDGSIVILLASLLLMKEIKYVYTKKKMVEGSNSSKQFGLLRMSNIINIQMLEQQR